MHELAITQAVVDAVLERTGDAPIAVVTLEIGALSGVLVDAVRFAFEVVADGTPVQGAALEVVEPRGRAHCRDCDQDFDVADPRILLCPGCGAANVAVIAGGDLRIRSVEVRERCVRPAGVPTTPESG